MLRLACALALLVAVAIAVPAPTPTPPTLARQVRKAIGESIPSVSHVTSQFTSNFVMRLEGQSAENAPQPDPVFSGFVAVDDINYGFFANFSASSLWNRQADGYFYVVALTP